MQKPFWIIPILTNPSCMVFLLCFFPLSCHWFSLLWLVFRLEIVGNIADHIFYLGEVSGIDALLHALDSNFNNKLISNWCFLIIWQLITRGFTMKKTMINFAKYLSVIYKYICLYIYINIIIYMHIYLAIKTNNKYKNIIDDYNPIKLKNT